MGFTELITSFRNKVGGQASEIQDKHEMSGRRIIYSHLKWIYLSKMHMVFWEIDIETNTENRNETAFFDDRKEWKKEIIIMGIFLFRLALSFVSCFFSDEIMDFYEIPILIPNFQLRVNMIHLSALKETIKISSIIPQPRLTLSLRSDSYQCWIAFCGAQLMIRFNVFVLSKRSVNTKGTEL